MSKKRLSSPFEKKVLTTVLKNHEVTFQPRKCVFCNVGSCRFDRTRFNNVAKKALDNWTVFFQKTAFEKSAMLNDGHLTDLALFRILNFETPVITVVKRHFHQK